MIESRSESALVRNEEYVVRESVRMRAKHVRRSEREYAVDHVHLCPEMS